MDVLEYRDDDAMGLCDYERQSVSHSTQGEDYTGGTTDQWLRFWVTMDDRLSAWPTPTIL